MSPLVLTEAFFRCPKCEQRHRLLCNDCRQCGNCCRCAWPLAPDAPVKEEAPATASPSLDTFELIEPEAASPATTPPITGTPANDAACEKCGGTEKCEECGSCWACCECFTSGGAR